ncbi:MAG: tRNA pseudouridine(38-40) synthase TruA [Paludibacteraceae bacterium]|nr:tRNA pseudouridine(38-40) synthase TruA [Paludibacteraceae bacterium]
MRYFIYFSYRGTHYHGWQIQPNNITVQEVLQEALSKIVREEVAMTGAGRTDTGVHASCMVAHFDLVAPSEDAGRMVQRLNSILPADIAVDKILPVAPDAHARFDAKSRTYKYYVTERKNAFSSDFSARILGKGLDYGKMNEAAQVLFDYIDFTSFSKVHTDTKTNNCKIMRAEWQKEGDFWVFTIQADRFLRNMVRAVVGTLFEVGRGKMTIDQFRQVIESKDRCKAGTSAPAEGLFLVDIEY